MGVRRSQGYLERLAGKVLATVTGTDIALVDGGGSADTITRTAADFVSEGFKEGYVEIVGAAATANNKYFHVVTVATDTLTLATAMLTAETAGNSITIRQRYPSTFAELFDNCQLDIYSGSIPTTPDDTENGTLLVSFTGIRFTTPTWDSTNKKAYCEILSTVSATAVATGTAAWGRLRGGGAVTTGASTTLVRIDGLVGVGSGEFRLQSTSITSGAPQALTSIQLRMVQA